MYHMALIICLYTLTARLTKFSIVAAVISFSLAYRHTTLAKGCSDCSSRHKRDLTPLFVCIKSHKLLNARFALSKVPVLSNTTVLILLADCRTLASRINIPHFSPLPTPTVTDKGVPDQNAQGQAIINTVVAITNMLADFSVQGQTSTKLAQKNRD